MISIWTERAESWQGTSNVDPRANSPEKISLPQAPWYPLPYISRRALKRVKDPLPAPETCRYCGPEFPVSLVNNEEIYGREYGDWPYAYLCANCDSYVGLHPGTDLPVGTLANRALREARKTNKAVFHSMMKRLGMSRTSAYETLAHELGIPPAECHWGWFDLERCDKAGQICQMLIDNSESMKRR